MSSDLLNVTSDTVGMKNKQTNKLRLFVSKTHTVQIYQRFSNLNLRQNHLEDLVKHKVAGPHP